MFGGNKKDKIMVPKTVHTIMGRKPCGVFFGKKDNDYIFKPESEDGHVLVVGSVGSGKSTCVAIPTLKYWNKSIFAIDIKGELHEKSKDYETRKHAKEFDPLDENAYGYDPFFSLKFSKNLAQAANTIALSIVPLPPDVKEPFWIENAQNVLTAAILHYYSEDKSFLETIEEILSLPQKELIENLCNSSQYLAKYYVNSMRDMEDKTLSSIMATLTKNIVHFATDSDLISALSRSKNITPQDLEDGNDIYISIPEHLLRQWKNLMALIVNQFLHHFEQREEKNAKPILFLLDEFPRLGKINPVIDGLATLRSKKITICIIIQNMAQLDVIYGENERKVIIGMCVYKAILSADDPDTQEYFSRLAGTYDKMVMSHGKNKGLMPLSETTSINRHEQESRNIKPQEFGMGMIKNGLILFTPFAIPVERRMTYEEYQQMPTGYLDNPELAPFMRVEQVRYDNIDK